MLVSVIPGKKGVFYINVVLVSLPPQSTELELRLQIVWNKGAVSTITHPPVSTIIQDPLSNVLLSETSTLTLTQPQEGEEN